jgi:hypothetical protein
MLGWHVTVYRLAATTPLAGTADVPALLESPRFDTDRAGLIAALVAGEALAIWQTGIHGLDWIDRLVVVGQSVELSGGGYPSTFVALARDLIPPILEGPPEANIVWTCGRYDMITPEWHGRTVIEAEAIEGCSPNEWLLVEAWDES